MPELDKEREKYHYLFVSVISLLYMTMVNYLRLEIRYVDIFVCV